MPKKLYQIRLADESWAIEMAQRCNALDRFPITDEAVEDYEQYQQRGIKLLGGGPRAGMKFKQLCEEQAAKVEA